MTLLSIFFKKIIRPLLIFVLFLCVTSCRTMEINGVSSLSIKIPEGINLSEDDFLNLFPESYFTDSAYSMVIVPFSYSPFVEITAFSGSEMINKKKSGEMKALVRIMEKEKIVKLFFIEVEEEGKENLLRAFSVRVNDFIPGNN